MSNAGKDMEQGEFSYTAKMVPSFWERVAASYKVKHAFTIKPNIPFLSIDPREMKTRSSRFTLVCPYQFHSKNPKTGNNPDVYQLVDRKTNGSTPIPWNNTQQGKGPNYPYMGQHGRIYTKEYICLIPFIGSCRTHTMNREQQKSSQWFPEREKEEGLTGKRHGKNVQNTRNVLYLGSAAIFIPLSTSVQIHWTIQLKRVHLVNYSSLKLTFLKKE